jgi:hypothetical protein
LGRKDAVSKMEDAEFEVMKETMLRVYGTVYIETNLTTGEKRVLNPKEITFIYSNNQGSHDYGRLHDFLLNMKLKLGVK